MSKEDFQEFVALISRQQTSYEKIKTLQTNYKKDSVSRKSIDYLNKRIEALQALWDEFRSNHEILKKYESINRDHDYFKQNIFEITKSMFNETIQSMNQLRKTLNTEPEFSSTSNPKTPEIEVTTHFDTSGLHEHIKNDVPDKHLTTLLRNQMCNFNALERAVSKTNLDNLKEKWQLQDHLNILQSKWEAIDKIHWEISYLLQGNDQDYEDKYDHWEAIYDLLKEDLNKKIFETSHYEKTTPRMELPEFNGNFNNWISFRDLFIEMIHNNPTLNKTQKMKFLKSKLRGEAEKLIKHLPSSIDQPNSNNLKKLYDTTKECINGLENINVDIPVWGPLLYTFQTDALVMSKLINNLPNSNIDTKNWTHLHNIKLADPDFNVSGPIDLLLGADIYSNIIIDGVLKQNNYSPVAQQTKLGWILCGATKQFNCLVTTTELDEMTRFWESEDIPSELDSISNDEHCEKYFTETTQRLSNGRYVVKMPMSDNYREKLGSSKPQAIAQFLQLEKKMVRQEHFAKLYKQFISDYIELDHMKPALESNHQIQAYLPHHGVIRECSTTTKLRAVFNASMKTDSGFSLNDLMEKGPNLQKDILSLVIKWRSYKYVLTADIEKMYRQILVHPEQQSLQKIIWRDSINEPLREMQLCTLTYGTKAAPFIAMRTLQQLAIDEGDNFPLAKIALQHDFYMDDAITGHHTIETTKLLQKELSELLKKGGFVLRKWATNEPSILKNLNREEKSNNNDFNFKQQEFSKTLGLAWNDASDTFHFTSETQQFNSKDIAPYTKRRLLSEISKIYDPLGWIAPMTIQAKLLFQKLWSDSCKSIGWDEKVPDTIEKEWKRIKIELPNLNDISIPRWIQNEHNGNIELHAFCDASEKAYACVIYSRTTSSNGIRKATLLAAKTKVAPIKKKTTIPRLELCAAVLLAKLLDRITKILAEYNVKVFCWTDSKVVLAWLQGNQTKYEKYITNRTTIIRNIVPANNWGYVNTNENPADCATRGLLPSKLIDFSLWWEGPKWLTEQEKQTIVSEETYTTNEGSLTNCYTINKAEPAPKRNELIDSLLERHSNIDRISRILAWSKRFAEASRKQRSSECSELTLKEINRAMCTIIKSVQIYYFENEILSLDKGGKLPTKSNILKLNPFLDSNGVLRVGGRLKHSNLPEESKHPILIPGEGRLTQLIIEKAHQQTLHGGARLTLAYTRNNYWIISGNRTVKKALRQCIRCRRYATSRTEQLMGNLPKERITPSRPFSHTGIDFTGHVDVKINKGRGIKTCKGYIAIFICMCTKAVHIELVSDLSTPTFIAALKRMCARRGTPNHIYSDNGTNFVGAAKILKEEFQLFKTMLSPEFFKEINNLQIEWHFNAPSWPSAGGLWEAAVRSMKAHLKRVIGQQKLTYEEFSTLLSQIEACMNSRPLSPLSEDVEDLDYLTPGHFLTGSPTLTLPLNDPEDTKVDIRNHWKLIELMRRQYWDRWSKEYLHTLQNRNKWQLTKENINKGLLVLLKESNLPPGKWAMGRVIELHPGSDKLVRVVSLKTQSGICNRSMRKYCIKQGDVRTREMR
ncbi:uncharacterized protein LOC111363382 [Spodoptera litura]|uniref:Uncharacterized protein LOC111363382 n=1 Tax=Spodoptera litura TaxID=69820 RepID=A0A9J7EUW5_SPOLT|nr:uncharacterized protein LOC111363382 [Spodoptera litura]